MMAPTFWNKLSLTNKEVLKVFVTKRFLKLLLISSAITKLSKNLTIKNGTVRHYMDSQNEMENKVKFILNLENIIQNKKKNAQKFLLNEGLYIFAKKN